MSDTDTQVPLPDLNNTVETPAVDDIGYNEDEHAAPASPPISRRFSTCRADLGRVGPVQDGHRRVLKLAPRHRAELDCRVGEAIDIHVNNRLVARGEVVLVEDKLGVTMTEFSRPNGPDNFARQGRATKNRRLTCGFLLLAR